VKLVATPGSELKGEAAIPGDKSCSHRALILGAMASGETRIRGLLESEDVLATARALQAFGVEVDQSVSGEWIVRGGTWRSPDAPVDCGNSGTAARLLMGAVASMPGVSATLTGDVSLSARPMQRITGPLSRMGAKVEGGGLPITIEGMRLGGIEHHNVPASAQVKSAILLAGLGTTAPVKVIEPIPTRDHTEIMLGQFGGEAAVHDTPEGWIVELGQGRALAGAELGIGADPSSAAFPLVAAALVSGSEVMVRGMIINPLRTGLYETLEAMGADIELSNERIQSGEIIADIRVRHTALRPCQIRAEQVPAMIDEIPALAVACAMADGESLIEGLGELRVKESDRLGAIIAGLAACGVVAMADVDSLRIFGRGRVRGGASILTQGDHRIAMAFLALGLAAEQPVAVDDAGMIATSFPGFTEVMRSLGGAIE
jgi:3-phosphoshikimate 1-carboxyvinyltransferase